MNRVLFICRGSVQDGLGHVMRSKQVAAAVAAHAKTKIVVLGDDAAENILAHQDIEYTITSSESHALSHVRAFAPDIVVFDMIAFDQESFDVIRAGARTISLSPIFNCLPYVDMVFHRTKVRGKGWASQGTDGPEYFCGLEYAVVSSHCQRIDVQLYKQNLEHDTLAVAISMGGADAANKTLAVLERLKNIPDKLLFWVLLGEGYAHSYEDLVRCIRGSKHEIILAKTNESMWRILNTCSVAILAGGTTTYEAAYAGLPSINTLETEEHFFLVQELVDNGACLFAGYTFDESLRAMRGIVGRLNRNRSNLFDMHERASRLIDGKGATRIAERVLLLDR